MFRPWIMGVLIAALLLAMPAHALDAGREGGLDVHAKDVPVGASYRIDVPMGKGSDPSPAGPDAPETVSAARIARGVQLSWDSSVDPTDDYVVRRDGIVIGSTWSLNFTDAQGTSLDAYTISARKSGKEGAPSDPAFAQSDDCVNIHQGAVPPIYLVPGTCMEQALALYAEVASYLTVALEDAPVPLPAIPLAALPHVEAPALQGGG